MIHFNIILHLRLDLSMSLFISGFPINILIFIAHVRGTCPAHLSVSP
jgi:hypothetical protein